MPGAHAHRVRSRSCQGGHVGAKLAHWSQCENQHLRNETMHTERKSKQGGGKVGPHLGLSRPLGSLSARAGPTRFLCLRAANLRLGANVRFGGGALLDDMGPSPERNQFPT